MIDRCWADSTRITYGMDGEPREHPPTECSSLATTRLGLCTRHHREVMGEDEQPEGRFGGMIMVPLSDRIELQKEISNG